MQTVPIEQAGVACSPGTCEPVPIVPVADTWGQCGQSLKDLHPLLPQRQVFKMPPTLYKSSNHGKFPLFTVIIAEWHSSSSVSLVTALSFCRYHYSHFMGRKPRSYTRWMNHTLGRGRAGTWRCISALHSVFSLLEAGS